MFSFNQLFYDRISGDPLVAKRIKKNCDLFARKLSSPNFMKELEKNVN